MHGTGVSTAAGERGLFNARSRLTTHDGHSLTQVAVLPAHAVMQRVIVNYMRCAHSFASVRVIRLRCLPKCQQLRLPVCQC